MSLLRPTLRRQVVEPEPKATPKAETLGNQESHFAELEAAWLLACEHPSEQKVQERFRERYRDYRDRYILPVEGGVLKR